MSIGLCVPLLLNPIYMFLSVASRQLLGVTLDEFVEFLPSLFKLLSAAYHQLLGVYMDEFVDVLTCSFFVLMCLSTSSMCFIAKLLTFIIVLLLHRVTDISYIRSYLMFGRQVTKMEDLKWSIFATRHQKKRKRARLRRRYRRQRGLQINRKKFRRRKLHYHLYLKCRRRIGNKPTNYNCRHEMCRIRAHQLSEIQRFRSGEMLRPLEKLQSKLKRAKMALDEVSYQSFVNDGVDKFEGYSSPFPVVLDDEGQVRVSRFCYVEDISTSTIDSFGSSFDPLESYKLMKVVEEQRLALESGSINDIEVAESVIKRAALFISTSKAYQSSVNGGVTFKSCPLVWDTGASFGLTPFRDDFIDYQEANITVQGIGSSNTIVGIGVVMWKFKTESGKTIHLPMIAYHLPSTNIRLFSPQVFHQLHGGSSHIVRDMGVDVQVKMKFQRLDEYETVNIKIDQMSGNVPMVENVSCTNKERKEIGPRLGADYGVPYDVQREKSTDEIDLEYQLAVARQALDVQKRGMLRHWNSKEGHFDYDFSSPVAMVCPSVGEDSNQNLAGPQKELLLWHWKLGISMKRIQAMMVEHRAIDGANESVIFPQVIKPRFKTTASCEIPLCTSCELARARRRSTKTSTKIDIEEKKGILACEQYEVGDFVSMDQYISKTSGRLPTGYGREKPENRYSGGTIFNDAASGAIWVENQVSLGAFETVMSKRKFEEWLYELARVEVSHYRSDNGIFVSEEFKEECKNLNQQQTFSGVGAQHMNARAERSIQTIMYMARSFMIHTALHWNEFGVDSISLWPFAVKHAAWLYNRLPNRVTGLTPIEMITQTKADHRDLLRTHVWGCPAFVLDPALQDGKKIPKWNARSRIGQFLGFSEDHSSSVALVRHLKTGHVSPQFHIVVDDKFQTVYGGEMDPDVYDAVCNRLWDTDREQYAIDEYDAEGEKVYSPPPLDDVWLDESERREVRKRKDIITSRRRRMQLRDKELEESIGKVPSPPVRQSKPRTPLTSTPNDNDEDDSVPGLVSNSDNSDDSSVGTTDSSVIHIPHESEGEINDINGNNRVGWDDHPVVINDYDDPPLPPTPNVPPPTPNNRPSLAPEGATDTDELAREQAAADTNDIISEREHASSNNNNVSPPVQRSPAPSTRQRVRRQRQRQPKQWTRSADGRLRRDSNGSVHYFGDMTADQLHAYKTVLSYQEKRKHEVSLCADMPTPAFNLSRRLSSTYHKPKQRLARLKRKGDELLRQDVSLSGDNITAEDIIKSPLSKFIHLAANECGYGGTVQELVCDWVHPLFLKAKSEASSQDNPNWWQAMNGPFADEYWKAACVEIETLENMDAWEVVDIPEGVKPIDSTWAFKLKRFPDGMIKKFKARLCARGDQQEHGIDYFETYAPVVQWTTVRLMLILEVLLDLKSKQGDVTAAFLHAEVEDDRKIYVNMPLGFRKKGKCLRLKRYLYGLNDSPREFFKYVVKRMKNCGMEQSALDPCLFTSDKVVCIVYVDDFLFWAKDEKDISELALKLREEEMDLEQEDDAAGFLGVRLEKTEDGLIEMKQTGLIDRIIETLGLDKGMVNGKATPAESVPLVKDEDGDPAVGDFNYASVVGMLLYLAGHSRPEIAYAVNCCARYMFCPKESHEKALKRLGRYLKQTRDRGLILKPTLQDGKLVVECFPDADFAGMYGHEKHTDPASAKSRTGFVITLASCPIFWQSKLQTETALSTMEAEIVALGHSCRELFPIIDMVKQVGPLVGLDVGDSNMNVSIHEDNAGALILAQTLPPQYTPRSKHYHIKTVWFREEIVKRGIKLLKIDTVEQLGDIFTKGLGKATFEYLRKKIMGW